MRYLLAKRFENYVLEHLRLPKTYISGNQSNDRKTIDALSILLNVVSLMTLALVMNDTQSCGLTSTPGFTGFKSTTLIISLVILYHFYAKKDIIFCFFLMPSEVMPVRA